jgi:hypothetical protein
MAKEGTSSKQSKIGAAVPGESAGQQGRESQDFFRRRIPCAERRVSEIRPDDVRVRVLGTVIDRDDTRVVVDDGTGRISAVFDRAPEVGLNQLVRIFGRIVPTAEGFELQADILQDMGGLDLSLHRRVSEAIRPGAEKNKKP